MKPRSLTYKQREALALLALGRNAPAIARDLGVAEETVHQRVRRAARRLGGAGGITNTVYLAVISGQLTENDVADAASDAHHRALVRGWAA